MREQATEQRIVTVQAGAVQLEGFLAIPPNATGIALFAHGSGSSRHSTRNQYVAEILRENNLATLLMDLLTVEEEQQDLESHELRFDMDLLAKRVADTVDWLRVNEETDHLHIGLIGSSTGAAAALIAAVERPDQVQAVVSRGGRPDLAAARLPKVQAPTLLIVGSNDLAVLELNQQAFEVLGVSDKRLEVIPGATHLFEEPGTLQQAAKAARTWFTARL
jgi:putative phosphoribosyl transferase